MLFSLLLSFVPFCYWFLSHTHTVFPRKDFQAIYAILLLFFRKEPFGEICIFFNALSCLRVESNLAADVCDVSLVCPMVLGV